MAEPKQLSLNSGKYSNKSLFTEHYLEEHVPAQKEWEFLHAEALEKLMRLNEKRMAIQPERLNEAQLEENWIRWILREILGHYYEVQVNIYYGDGKRGVPDYVLTENHEAAQRLGKEIKQPSDLEGAIAVCDAKTWGENFDKSGKGSSQIDKYLRYSELPWGILTDGRYWRLYERNSSKYNHYYEIDLEALIERKDTNDFLYFYLFFRREAFTSGWLERVLKGSQDYAEKLRDSLEDEVFSALEDIAQGFLDYRRNQIAKPPSSAELALIYEESLVLLYRLLFIFYAESRAILPMGKPEYSRRSLRNLAESAKHMVQFPSQAAADDTKLYAQLEDLFFLIDEGNDKLDIPAYNGKLFSANEHPFLASKKVGDKHLAPAIYKIATVEVRRERKVERVSVDYQDLEVSHLGTIYEKLLEYQLAYTSEDLITSGKEQSYKKADKNQKPTKPAGSVYLRTGNNQRKVTGSYYTPDYIVSFIVEKTLEPLLLEITETHASQLEDGSWQVRDAVALRDAILALNVLDPATGSGHFVVDVVVYIAKWLDSLGLDLPELANESDELSYWMRQVAGSCIYAVDINPLAVELAKLSLWLKTLARDKPLSFLDHHIRVGNSLVGAKLAEIEEVVDEKKIQKIAKRKAKLEAEGNVPLFSDADFTRNVSLAVGQMVEIERVQASHVRDVKRQEEIYADLRQKLRPYEQLAHIWTARDFGLNLSSDEWKACRHLILAGAPNSRVQEIINQADSIAKQPDLRFFHWEVAFPEVFFDMDGKRLEKAGFDAVVGNPPYVRWQSLHAKIKDYFSDVFKIYHSSADLLLYFFEAGLSVLKNERRLGFITTGSFMDSSSAVNFRQLVAENYAFDAFVDFGPMQPFRGVDFATNVAISIIRNGLPNETFNTLVIEDKILIQPLDKLFIHNSSKTLSKNLGLSEWRFQSLEITKLYEKVSSTGEKLVNYVDKQLYYGILTGRNEAFYITPQTRKELIEKDKSSAEIIVDFVRGENLRTWYQTDNPEYLIFARQGINIENYPAVKDYLEQFHEILEPRPQEHKGSWKGRTSGNYKWYEWHDTVAYHGKFAQKKILAPDIGKFPRFSWDESGLYCNDKGYIIVPESISLLAILNSRVTWFVLSQIATPLAMRAGLWRYQSKIQFIERLPIPELSPEHERDLAEIAESISQSAKKRYQLHENVRRDMRDDLAGGKGTISSRVALYEWWNYDPQTDFAALNKEIKSQLGQELAVGKQRDDWRKYLTERRQQHLELTAAIVSEEIRLNNIVYDAFGLDESEQQLIESATKYPYGAV